MLDEAAPFPKSGMMRKSKSRYTVPSKMGRTRLITNVSVPLRREVKVVRPSSVRGITAERVARATFYSYLKQKREVVVPWTMHVPIKIYQLFPGLVEWAMARMARGE